MSFSRRTLSLVTFLLILAVLGAGVGWRLWSEGDSPDEATAAETNPDLPDVSSAGQFSTDVPQPVRGAEASRDTLWIRVSAEGRAEAYRRATLSAQVEGRVDRLPARENALVGNAGLLLQIDTIDLALNVAQAEADLMTAQAEYRQITLFDDEIVDDAIREERNRIARTRSQFDQRQVALRQAQIQLARSRVTAPFGGRVADLKVVEGQYVTVGTELMTVIDLDPIKVEVQVLEAALPTLSAGRRAEVTFSAFPGEEFLGRIRSINPMVDPETRTARVTVLLPNPDHRIKPGMYAEVSMDAEALPDRMIVPRAALLERGDGRRRTILFVYEPKEGESHGLAKWRYVSVGRENDTHVEILPDGEGIVEPGEVVLVDGHHYLAHDTPVRLVEDVSAEGGRPGR